MAYEASEAAPRCCDVRKHTLGQPQGGTWVPGCTLTWLCRYDPLVAANSQEQQEIAQRRVASDSRFVKKLRLGPSS